MAPAVDKMQEDAESKKKAAKSDKDKSEKKEEPELVSNVSHHNVHAPS